MMEPKDCPLQFPELPNASQPLPRFLAVVANEEDLIAEDLDVLQLELESILSSVTKRMVILHTETHALSDWQDKKDKKGIIGKQGIKDEVPTTPTTTDKRGRTDDKVEKPTKRMKETSGKLSTVQTTHTGPGRPKSKSIHKLQEYEFTDDPLNTEPITPRIVRNDAPDRFWASVEPYCAEITNEDIKALDELIRTPDDDSDIFKIPALGKHYSVRWANEDLMEEQKEGSKIDQTRGGSSPDQKESKELLAKIESSVDDDLCQFGQLTQRLISALVEENIMTPIEDIIMDTNLKDDNGDESVNSCSTNGDRAHHVGRNKALENRIREELVQLGLLDPDDPLEDLEQDEILSELEKRIMELKSLSAHNRTQKEKLISLAKDEMKKQEIQKRIGAADNEVMEAFRRIMAAKQKKRTPTKKEREQAENALQERKALLEELDGL